MKISSRERTGLRTMVEFAGRFGDGPTSLHEVARVQELPVPYLEHVAAALRRSGLLESVRGAHGGYMLGRGPAEISVADIFRAVEEDALLPLDCMRTDGSPCSRELICATRNVWQILSDRLSETLEQTSLADIVSG